GRPKMMKSVNRSFRYCAMFWWAVLTLFLLTGCTGDKANPATGGAAMEKELPWKGVSLHLVVVADEQLAEAIKGLRGEWQGATGAELDVLEASEADLLGDNPPQADAVIFPAYDLGILVERERLKPLSDKVLGSSELAWSEVFETDKSHDASW